MSKKTPSPKKSAQSAQQQQQQQERVHMAKSIEQLNTLNDNFATFVDQRIMALTEENKKLKAEIEELRKMGPTDKTDGKMLWALEQDNNNLTARVTEMEGQLHDLRNKLKSEEMNNQTKERHWNTNVATLKADIDGLRSEIERRETQISGLNEEIARLRKENVLLHKKWEEASSSGPQRVAEHQKQTAEQELKLVKLRHERELAFLRQNVEDLYKEREAWADGVYRELDNLKAYYREYQEEQIRLMRDQHREKLDNLDKIGQTFHERMRREIKQLSSDENEVHKIRTDRERLAQVVQDMEGQLTTVHEKLHGKLSEPDPENKTLHKEIARLSKELHESRMELGAMKGLEDQVARLKQEIKRYAHLLERINERPIAESERNPDLVPSGQVRTPPRSELRHSQIQQTQIVSPRPTAGPYMNAQDPSTSV